MAPSHNDVTETNEKINRNMESLRKDPLVEAHVPHKVPSLIEIKKAIPKHCFESDFRRSIMYGVKDFGIIIGLNVGMTMLNAYLLTDSFYIVKATAWFIYWIMQSIMFTAIFVLGRNFIYLFFF